MTIINSERCDIMARVRKSIDSLIAEIDVKIAKKKEEIAQLETKKDSLLRPVNWRTVMAKAKENGLTAKQVADKLGLGTE